jgi:hypothetical protein
MLGAGAIALAVPLRNAQATTMPKPKIALQLYTVRKAIESDFEGTMRKVADVGFLGVETYTLPSSSKSIRIGRRLQEWIPPRS